MTRSRTLAQRIRPVLLAAALGLAPAAGAEIVVLDYDDAEPVDFRTDPYVEDGVVATVDSGHYEVMADGGGPEGDRAFSMDQELFGPSQVTLTAEDGGLFDVLSLEVVNPASAPGEYTISAVGGGNPPPMPAPTVAGMLSFDQDYEGISALVIQQNSSGTFTIDDVTIRLLPEPGATASLLASLLLLVGLRHRRLA